MEILYKKVFISGTALCLTGLHIGDSKDSVNIGGADGPVIRRKDNNEPYIPGSSLKGKMRSLLQQLLGEDTFEMSTSNISQLFGGVQSKTKNSHNEPQFPNRISRLIVRDAYLERILDNQGELIGGSAYELLNSKFTDMPYTEQKYENTIDRKSGTTINGGGGIRNQERVPAGAKFELNFVLNVFVDPNLSEEEKAKNATTLQEQYLRTFWLGIKLLESDYLGGSGSRGYGQLALNISVVGEKTRDDFEKDAEDLLKIDNQLASNLEQDTENSLPTDEKMLHNSEQDAEISSNEKSIANA